MNSYREFRLIGDVLSMLRPAPHSVAVSDIARELGISKKSVQCTLTTARHRLGFGLHVDPKLRITLAADAYPIVEQAAMDYLSAAERPVY